MTILSIIFIFVVHQLIIFFKENLTVPKIKDLINAPSQKYENIYEIISSNKNDNLNTNNLTNEHLIPKHNVENMKNELKSFFKEQNSFRFLCNSPRL
jgi:protein-arginine kinase